MNKKAQAGEILTRWVVIAVLWIFIVVFSPTLATFRTDILASSSNLLVNLFMYAFFPILYIIVIVVSILILRTGGGE